MVVNATAAGRCARAGGGYCCYMEEECQQAASGLWNG